MEKLKDIEKKQVKRAIKVLHDLRQIQHYRIANCCCVAQLQHFYMAIGEYKKPR